MLYFVDFCMKMSLVIVADYKKKNNTFNRLIKVFDFQWKDFTEFRLFFYYILFS